MPASADWTPLNIPLRLTAGDVLVPLDPFSVWTADADEVETEATVTAVVATIREKRRPGATLVATVPVSAAGPVVTFGSLTVPDKPGEWWWDLEAAIDGVGSITLISAHCHILHQVSVVAP